MPDHSAEQQDVAPHDLREGSLLAQYSTQKRDTQLGQACGCRDRPSARFDQITICAAPVCLPRHHLQNITEGDPRRLGQRSPFVHILLRRTPEWPLSISRSTPASCGFDTHPFCQGSMSLGAYPAIPTSDCTRLMKSAAIELFVSASSESK